MRTEDADTTWTKQKEAIKDRLEKKSANDSLSTESLKVPDAFNIPDELLTLSEKAMRDAWKGIIVSRTEAKYFFTVAFKVHCDNEEGINSLGFYLRAINRNLFGHEADKYATVGLKGMCIVEPHMLSPKFYGQCHYHMLIDGNPGVKDVQALRLAVREEMKRVRTVDKWPMLDSSVVDVRDIWSIHGLADYLTKTYRMHVWKTMGNICFVEPKGLTGVCVSYQRKARNY